MIGLRHIIDTDNAQSQNLYRLFMLRNLLIIAAVALLALAMWRNIEFHLTPLLAILLGVLSVNLLTGWWLFSGRPVTDGALVWQLVIDVAVFTGALYFTGGASNPFGWFYLVPIFIAATLLPGQSIWLITSLSIVGYTVLMFFYEPIMTTSEHSGHAGHLESDSAFNEHIIGMWIGYMMTALLVAYVVARMANSLRERDQHIAKAREKALRDERLVALGTLAAGTAHELGTPLSTIAVLVNEMQANDRSAEDTNYLGIIRDQVDRCKQALATISHSAGEELMTEGSVVPIDKYLTDIVQHWQQLRPDTKIEIFNELRNPDAMILAEKTMTQALTSILNNAADASPKDVGIRFSVVDNRVRIEVLDRGDGLDSMVQSHAGRRGFSSKEQGMGLGLFLAYASIERLGGQVILRNREQGGANISINLPLLDYAAEMNK